MVFLPVQYVIDIRTANLLIICIDSENTVCKTLARRDHLELNNPLPKIQLYKCFN